MKQLKQTHLTKKLLSLIALLLFAVAGAYLVFVSEAAEAPELAGMYGPRVLISWDGGNDHANTPVGADLSTPISFQLGGLVKLPSKMSVVASTYYASKYLKHTGINCAANVRCVSVAWPNFDKDPSRGTFMNTEFNGVSEPASMADFAFDRKFSICANVPSLDFSGNYLVEPLYTPNFVVVNNSKRFVIATVVRYYVNGNCATNGGQTDKWYKTTREMSWYQCYNGTSVNPEGGYTGPFYDGSRNSCFDPGNILPGGNDIVNISGGLQNGDNGAGDGSGPVGPNDSNSGLGGGSSGGSSAKHQSEQPNKIPSSSSVGDNHKAEIEPSPFFDGRNFEQGSDPNNLAVTVSSTRERLVRTWPIVLAVILFGGSTGYLIWKYRYKFHR